LKSRLIQIIEQIGGKKIYGLTESGEYLLIALADRDPDSV